LVSILGEIKLGDGKNLKAQERGFGTSLFKFTRNLSFLPRKEGFLGLNYFF